jgi:ABC-type thiamine transport system substrate-binding protein
MSGRLVLPALHHLPFPHRRKTIFLQRPTRSSQGRALLARSSKTLYGEDGPHTLVGEGKEGGVSSLRVRYLD